MNPKPAHSILSRHRNAIGLIVVTLVALGVRLLYLGRAELWGDEILFVIRDGYPSVTLVEIYKHMLSGFSTVTHLPFPLMVHNLLIRLLISFILPAGANGLNPFWFRFPAALWGTAAVPFTYLLLRRRLPHSIVWLSTAWMAVGYFPVYYSREAYFYAPLIALSILTLHFWLRGLETLSRGQPLPRLSMLGLLVTGTAVVHSHLAGILLQAVLFLAAGGAVLLPRHSSWRVPGAWRLALLSLVPLLFATPFLRVWLTQGVQSGMEPGTALGVILWDVAGKFFLGNLPPLNAIGLVILLLGAGSLFRTGTPENPAPRWIAGLGTVLFLALQFGAHWSSYLARYFSPIAPLILTANTCGIALLARWTGRLPGLRRFPPSRVFQVMGGGVIALNLLILPLIWMPTSRARDYGAIADWLNQNLPAGGAYLWESAYETRFVSDEAKAPFRTPNRLAMRPFIHSGSEEIGRLRDLQRDLLERYPEIPWIDNRHGQRPGMEFGDWEWPRTYFHRFVLIENRSFDLQDRFRINIYPLGRVLEIEKSIPIWFNEPGDMLANDHRAGRPGSLFYPGWRFEATQTDGIIQAYARVHNGPDAAIQAVSLNKEETAVMFTARLAISRGDNTANAILELHHGTNVLSHWSLPNQLAFQSLESAPFPLPPEGALLELHVNPENPDPTTRIWLERAELSVPPHKQGF